MRCNEGHEMHERTGNAEFELAQGVSVTLKGPGPYCAVCCACATGGRFTARL